MNGLASHLVSPSWEATPAEPEWLAVARKHAWEQLADKQLPTIRQENWKYTNLELLARRQFSTSAAAPSSAWIDEQLAGLDGALRLVFIDGEYAAEHSATGAGDHGIKIGRLGDYFHDPFVVAQLGDFKSATSQGFTLLATARFKDGVYVGIEEDRIVDSPIEIVYITTGDSVCHYRNFVRLGAGAKATVSEHFISTSGSTGLLNNHMVVELSAGSGLVWLRAQRHDPGAFLVTRTEVRQDKNSKFDFFGLDTGGRLVRHDIHSKLEQPGAEVHLAGATVIAGQQHNDNHTEIEHIARDCISRERFKAVAAGRSRVVFNGKIKVHQGADGTDSSQSNANLLLSAHAEIDTKPELEIYADDVIAAHGATVGQLDETAVFYLRSRGLSELEARQLLISGFCRELVDRVSNPNMRKLLESQLIAALPEAGAA